MFVLCNFIKSTMNQDNTDIITDIKNTEGAAIGLQRRALSLHLH